jgi:hypothetical protein
VSLERPTFEELVKHAKLFGTEQVLPTAETYLTPEELVRLKVELQQIAAQHKRTKKPRIWYEDVPKVGRDDALALHAEGLTLEEVAKAVGVKVGQCRRWLYSPSEAPIQAPQSAIQREKAEKTASRPKEPE